MGFFLSGAPVPTANNRAIGQGDGETGEIEDECLRMGQAHFHISGVAEIL